ncbi:hypothetical protein QR680_009571 [Steinernema hermaphroditum]|uniref:Protein polybromo-1 n=1 Tax=Steinernema hermaphroditum TaxID=289476 RepID=A0AA39IKU6_9BILA|nr:hypothetical protein QR680_009571 [Steinernema hermaphroditum]
MLPFLRRDFARSSIVSFADRRTDSASHDSLPSPCPAIMSSVVRTKRRRASEEALDERTPKSAKRQRNIKVESSEHIPQCRKILEDIMLVRSNDGRIVCDSVFKAPSKRLNPEYYQTVSQPIDIARIQLKLSNEEYASAKEFFDDITLLVDNQKKYYEPGNSEYEDACLIWEGFVQQRSKYFGCHAETPFSRSPAPSVSSARSSTTRHSRASESVERWMLEALLVSLVELTDSDGRLLSPPFRVLASREQFPEYYTKIKHPVDMKTIAQRIRDGAYSAWTDIEKDVTLLCANAKKFNDAESVIHKDAEMLLQHFATRKGELMRLKRGFGKASLDHHKAVVDELLEAEAGASPEYSEDSEEDDDTENSDNPLWILYWTVRNVTASGSSEEALCEPFLELPSRSYYPDYYDEIDKPISLFMINKRLKAGDYTLESLTGDMNTMFENAKSYNSDGSNIFKAAAKLQKIMNDKVTQLSSSRKSSPMKKSGKRKTMESPSSSPSKFINGSSKSPSKRLQMEELVCRYKERLMTVWNAVRNHTEAGRLPSDCFLYLPCDKTYPDYYEVIGNPIDLSTIKKKIEDNKYSSSNKMYLDIKLMFDNARTYNEQKSTIYADANTLEAVAIATLKSISTSTIFCPLNRTPRSKTGEGPFSRSRRTPKGNKSGESKLRRVETTPSSGALIVQKPLQLRNSEEEKMWKLFCTINEFRTPTGQLLATAFAKVPSRMEYPEYYNVIKKPIDLQRIHAKLTGGYYADLRALISDFRLLFENACKFNEPDSTIYKEAFHMQRVLNVTITDMIQQSNAVGSVQMEVKMILMDLLEAICSHTDVEGKCYGDALVDIHEVFAQKGLKRSTFPFSLDELKTHIEKGRYRRLDKFQDDLFNLFAKAREVTTPSSRIFKATEEMQLFFIQKRNDLCRNRLDSPAIFYNDTHLKREISMMQREKNQKTDDDLKEAKATENGLETMDARESQKDEKDLSTKEEVDVVIIGDVEYHVDDYCYVEPADESTKQPHILRIQKLYKDDDDKDGGYLIYGFWCYRPRETYHLVTRRFYPNEVFLTPFTDTVVSSRLQGRCLVMFVEDYLRKKPVGFDEKDVFACEQKYLGRQLHFKRFRSWPHARDFKDKIQLVDREELLKPEKVPSDFANMEANDGGEATSNDGSGSSRSNEYPPFFDIDREEVVLERKTEASTSEGNTRTFFEQMCHRGRWYRLGDCVLVFNPNKPFCDVYRIGSLWRVANKSGTEEAFFSGVWFARPREIKHEKGHAFSKREVIAVEQPDVIQKMDNVQAKCAVLPTALYTKNRLTEIPECDVFVVEHRVAGKEPSNGKCSLFSKPTFEKVASNIEDSSSTPEDSQLNGGDSAASSSSASMQEETYLLDMRSARPLKRLRNCTSTRTVDDEVLYLKTALVMEKQMSPLTVKTEAELPIENRDLDKEALTIKNPPATPGTSTGSGENTPNKDLAAWLAVQPKLNSKSKSGYILFSAEIRKRIMNENPEAGFGEVSKIVGIEWKKLSDEEKKQYEVRAQYISDERAKLAASTPSQKALQPGQVRVFMCRWQLCDWQFDCEEGLYDHLKTAHTSLIVDGENQYVCLWASCIKYRKEGKPFPSLPRLHRHIKEKHLPTTARPIFPNQRNKNYYVYQPPNLTNATPGAAAQMTGKFINHPYGMPLSTAHSTAQGPTTVVTGQQIIVNGHPQTIPPGHAVIQAGGVPPRMISAQMPVKQVLKVIPSTSTGQGGPAIVYSAAGQQLPSGSQVQYVQHTAVVQQQYSSDPSTSHQPQQVQQVHHPQQVIIVQDPARAVLPQRPEPVFVPPPNSVHVKRVLHSEIYLRYIESMSHGKRQRHVSKWDRNLSANPRNTAPTRTLPYHWLKGANLQGERPREEDVVRGLWRLRTELMSATLDVECREVEPVKW